MTRWLDRRSLFAGNSNSEEAPLLTVDVNSGKLVLVSCLTGLLTGTVVVGFEVIVHSLQDLVSRGILNGDEHQLSVSQFVRTHPPSDTLGALLLAPMAGAVVVIALRRLVGGWTPAPLLPAAPEPTPMAERIRAVQSVAREPAKLLAAAASLGTGNSLGPEGPTVQFGGWLGVSLSKQLAPAAFNQAVLKGSGAAAAVGAAFGAPLSGIFFAIETSLSDSPKFDSISRGVTVACIFLSSIVSSEFSAFLLGEDGRTAAIFVPRQVLLASSEGVTTSASVVLGIACGLLSSAFYFSDKIATEAFQKAEFNEVPPWALTILGSLMCGALSLAVPEVRFGGFDDLNAILGQPGLATRLISYTPALLLQIVAVKLLATSICKGSGLVGGIYAPAIYIGGLLGLAYADSLQLVLPSEVIGGARDDLYAFVGMAAMLGGRCRIPLTSILLLLELTRNYDILPPIASAVGLSYWIASYLEQPATPKPEDTDEPEAASEPCTVTFFEEFEKLSTKSVSDYIIPAATVKATDPVTSEVVDLVSSSDPGAVLALDSDGSLAGLITAKSLVDAMRPSVSDISDPSTNDPGKGPLTCADACDPANLEAPGAWYRCTDEDCMSTAYYEVEEAPLPMRYLPVVAQGTEQALGLLDCEELFRVRLSILADDVKGDDDGCPIPTIEGTTNKTDDL